jgi:adenosine deaminase CECR1
MMVTKKLLFLITLMMLPVHAAIADWFDDLKVKGNAEDLYRVLYYMPKGGDLHNHLTGSAFPEWWYDAALAEKERGYEYRQRIQLRALLPDVPQHPGESVRAVKRLREK